MDPQEQLTVEQQQLVLNALRQKIVGEITCPLTKDSDWEVQEYLARLPAGHAAPSLPLGRSFPTAVVVCRTCGYTIFANIYRLGVAEELGAPPQEKRRDVAV
jgi:hypothetical protein